MCESTACWLELAYQNAKANLRLVGTRLYSLSLKLKRLSNSITLPVFVSSGHLSCSLVFFTTGFTEQNNAIGVLIGEEFSPLTNFTFRFVCKVSSPVDESADHNGFMVEVKTCGGSGAEEKGYARNSVLCDHV